MTIDLISSIEKEVKESADKMSAEILLLLIDKMDFDAKEMIKNGLADTDYLLGHYVNLKIWHHRLQKKYERDWYLDKSDQNLTELKLSDLKFKIKEARKNYYVSKRRFQTKCSDECTCRGCRCIKNFPANGP